MFRPPAITSRLEREDSEPDYELARLLLRRDRAMDRFVALVVKALSWSLRSLVPRNADAVRRYVEKNASELPALALRETRTKLATDLKNPGRSKRAAPVRSRP